MSEELGGNGDFRMWWRRAVLSGRGQKVEDEAIQKEGSNLERKGGHRSNDLHVLALANVSGARLLYTNDRDLQRDFKNGQLISNPRGKIYTTLGEKNRQLRSSDKVLLGRTDLCGKLR